MYLRAVTCVALDRYMSTSSEPRATTRLDEIADGYLDASVALPREVFRQAVRDGAVSVIVCHNHPSGDPEPSRADVALTRRLQESGELIGISLLDHIVFGDGRYVSLKERNLM